MAFSHGTQSGYNKYGCRCDECRAAIRRKQHVRTCESCGGPCVGQTCRACVRQRAVCACIQCGAPTSPRSRTRFCSTSCSGAYQSATRGGAPRKGRTCAECGGTFDANVATQACCSVACRRAYDAARRVPPEPKPESSRVYFPTCKGCARVFTARSPRKRWCSYRCQVNNASERVTSFYALACDLKQPGESHKWRTVLLGYLVERDGDRCAICRKRVDMDLPSGPRGDKSGRGPSIDHVIPRSQGGSDDLSNLRLTCWRCNQRRGNRGGLEQLALVG